MSDASLNELADTAGIEPRYWDIHGRLHERSPATARHLLAGLGIPANTETDIATSLTRLAEEPWRKALPSVITATEGCEIEVPFHLPTSAAGRSLRWSIEFEGGGSLSGDCRLDTVPTEAMYEISGSTVALRRLRLPPQSAGYHRFCLQAVSEASTGLVVAPARCYLPWQDAAQRSWGIAVQLYALRSRDNWGIGDFSDLGNIVDWSAAKMIDTIGLNPLHALFLESPQDASPYSPSSRLFLNPLYLDVTAVPEFAASAAAHALTRSPALVDAVRSARGADVVDYRAVAAAKCAVLEVMFRHFSTTQGANPDGRGRAFRDYLHARGDALRQFATFQALSEHLGTHEWTRWPEAYRDPTSAAVRELARVLEQRVSYFQYLQWQCEVQLSAASDRARAKGVRLGLYGDLAVSVDADGADPWAHQDLFVQDARVGAPPDPFNESGQEWGVVPLDPRRLRATGYAHFIALLRANMRHMGALRIDHIMGWQRLFFVPAGGSPTDGAYVRYPLDDLLAIAALESVRNRCLVIGEDLGTVPAGFRERMTGANILSSRVLYFEFEHGRLRRPTEFPKLASVSAATHDLATLRGYWTGDDIAARARLGMFKSPKEEQQARSKRARDKALLLQALVEEGLMPGERTPGDLERQEWTPGLSAAIHVYLARASSRLLMIQLDDLAGESKQANLPGSTVGYPNWRKRLDRSLEELQADPILRQAAETITLERRRGSGT